MQTTILESMYKAKSCLGHVDIDEPPEAYCQVCNSKLETSWQRITLQQDTSMPHLLDDSERGLVGFWVISDACPTCAANDEETKNRLALRARYDKSGVPPIHQKYTLRARTQPCGRVSLPDSEHQLYAQELCDGYKVPQWVFLGGSVGVGKTTILSALFCDMVLKDRADRSFLWTTESGLYKKADLASEASHAARVRVMSHAASVDILMIDDLAGNRRSLTDWQGGAMRDLIDERHRYQRPTFFTSNLQQWSHVEQRYGSHIVSRMVQSTSGLVLIDGPDLRYGAAGDL